METYMQETNDPAATYNSNPFTLAFDAIGRFFNTNLNWAIAIIVLGFFGLITQLGQSFIDKPTSTQTTTDTPSYPFSNIDTAQIVTIVAIVAAVIIVVLIIASVIDTFVKGMFAYTALQSEEGRSVAFSEAFHEVTARFGRLFFATLLANLKIFGWMLLFIVPGIIAVFRYTLLPYQIMGDSKEVKSVKDSHDATKLLVKGRLMEVFGISFVSGLIPIVGPLLAITGNAALYRQLKYSHDYGTAKPQIHFLNYIGLILYGLLFLFVIGITVILIAVMANR